MNIQVNTLPKSSVELTIQVTPEEYQPALIKAAKQISKDNKIEGFRPGSAPYDVIKQKFGEAEILNQALSDIITQTFVNAIQEKKLDTLGQPEINITKMAPGNDLIYSAKVIIIPHIKLADLNSISLTKTTVKVEDKEVEDTLKQVAKSRATETLIDQPVQDKNLVKIDYNISIDNVPQEDGQQKDFAVYLGEKHMVPGFEEKIIGLKADQTKKFDIKFPDDYFQKNFAGKTCTFDVKVKGVYKLDIPQIDDEFAKSLGKFKDIEQLKKQIEKNTLTEKENKHNKQLEQDVLKKIIDKSDFGQLPDKMIENEIETMLHELEHDLTNKGLNIETWLANMKKTMEQFKKDLEPQAELRTKSALIIRTVGQQQKIKVDDEEVDKQIEQLTQAYQDNQQALDHFKSAEYKSYLANIMTGQKIMDWLKEKIVK